MTAPPTLRTFLEQPRQLALRKWVFQIHLYMGLLLGAYVVAVSVTGSALVFRPEIEPSLINRPASRPAADGTGPFQASWNNLRRAYPGHAINSFSLNQYPGTSPGDPYRVKLQSGSRTFFAYVDSSSGHILGTQHPAIRWLQDLHFDLFGGQTGLIVNGVGAILFVVMCISGAVIWWPGRRGWTRGFAIAWRARWQNVNYDLHGVIGVTTTVLLAAVAVAGVYLVYERVYGYHPEEVAWQANIDSWAVDLDAVVRRADAVAPGGIRTYLYLPKSPSDNFRFDKSVADTPFRVFLDQSTADVVRVDTRVDTSAGAWIDKWFSLIHHGRFWGYASRIAWVVLGMAPLVLFLTGVLMWWNRVLARKRRRLRPAARPG